jgi:hypothetical protein
MGVKRWMLGISGWCALQVVFASACLAQSTVPASAIPSDVVRIGGYYPENNCVLATERNGMLFTFRQSGGGKASEVPAKGSAYAMYLLADGTIVVPEVQQVEVVDFSKGAVRSISSPGLQALPIAMNDTQERLATEVVHIPAKQEDHLTHSVDVLNTHNWNRASMKVDRQTLSGVAFSGDTLFLCLHSQLLSADTSTFKDGDTLQVHVVGEMHGQLLAMSGQTPVYVDGENLYFGKQKTKIGEFADWGAYTIGDSVLVWGRTEKYNWKIFRAHPEREAELVAEVPAYLAKPVTGIGGRLNFFWMVVDDQHLLTIDGQWKQTVVPLPKLK